MLVFLQTLEGWVYKDPIHGPLDGPLYMGSIYSNTRYFSFKFQCTSQIWVVQCMQNPSLSNPSQRGSEILKS